MPTVSMIAQVCHEANRAYCAAIGDHSQVAWSEAPEWQTDSAILGVSKIRSGEITGPADSHESWYQEKALDGWKYGELKDPDRKEHPCMVPHAELPPAQKMKDVIFFAIATAMLAV